MEWLTDNFWLAWLGIAHDDAVDRPVVLGRKQQAQPGNALQFIGRGRPSALVQGGFVRHGASSV